MFSNMLMLCLLIAEAARVAVTVVFEVPFEGMQ
jgi:hypothetical protein